MLTRYGGVTCVRCGGAFGLLDRAVAVRLDRSLHPSFPPLVAAFPMHGDCEAAHERDLARPFAVVERSPLGYPLRYERRAA